MSDLYWLTDAQMARLQPYFPKSHGEPRVDDRRALSGIVFVNGGSGPRPALMDDTGRGTTGGNGGARGARGAYSCA